MFVYRILIVNVLRFMCVLWYIVISEIISFGLLWLDYTLLVLFGLVITFVWCLYIIKVNINWSTIRIDYKLFIMIGLVRLYVDKSINANFLISLGLSLCLSLGTCQSWCFLLGTLMFQLLGSYYPMCRELQYPMLYLTILQFHVLILYYFCYYVLYQIDVVEISLAVYHVLVYKFIQML